MAENSERASSKLGAHWVKVASHLGIEVATPFTVTLTSGVQVHAAALVRNFGAVHGMLLVTDYATIKPHCEELVLAGYGYSVLGSPADGEALDLESCIEVLRDWGWSGGGHEPDWLAA